MRVFYTGEDIEELAASGVRQLEIGPGVALTDVARQLAHELGIELVKAEVAQPVSAPAPTGSLGAKPRGCQHGPIQTLGDSAAADNDSSGSVVNRLVDAVSRMADRRS